MIIKPTVFKIIRLYQILIRPGLKSLGLSNRCRFYPTCSDYTQSAIKQYCVLKGLVLGFKRIMRCQPFGNWGLDPVR